ncbi:hypothetical protein LCGC14_2837540, partial [marine sediment metagenome]
SAGNIGAAAIDTLEFDTDLGQYADLINISGTMFAVAYQGPSGDGWLATFNIASNGTIDNATTATSEFDTANCSYPRILNVSGDVYAIAYRGTANAFIKTLTISGAGAISAVTDTLELESSAGTFTDMVNVSGTVFAVSYLKLLASTGFIETFTISPSGTFSAVIGILEFEPTEIQSYPAIISIPNSAVVCMVYGGPDLDGFAKTALIDGILPAVTTLTCDAVVGDTATGRGNITSLGNSSVTAHGHCWDTSINPTTANDNVDNGAASTTGGFSSNITGLIPGTVYYTRAFVTNSTTTVYGANVRFTAALDRAGIIWMEGSNLRGFDENAIERLYIHRDDTGIADTDVLVVDDADAADDDYAKFTTAGLEGRSYQELVNDISGVIKATDVEVSELSTATYD